MLKEFRKRKEEILKAYDILSKETFVDKNSIEKWKKDLEEEEFIVSFCGMIKAGKSTLLNALIFRRPILPSKITPHTAKLTLIRYGEKESFKVKFYSPNEWEELRKVEKRGVNYFDKYLKGEVNERIKRGIYPDDLLGKTEELNSLEELNKFVGADGDYTPFVKEVTIYYPNPILKDLTIVDTPGTNDPNPLRSAETLKWIQNSNAVVYVVYAGQAFSKPDIDFINEYLLTVPSNLLIFAVNKVDTVSSLEEVKAWVEEVRKEEELKVRGIMRDEKSIVYVSALGGLIDRMIKDCEEKGIDPEKCIPEELIEVAEELYEKGFLNEEKHGIVNLERVIEEKLISTKGLHLLCIHKQRVVGLLERRALEVNKILKTKEERLNALSFSREEIEKKRNKLQEDRKKLYEFKEKLIERIENSIAKFAFNIENISRGIITKKIQKLVAELPHLISEDYEDLSYELAFKTKDILYEIENDFRAALEGNKLVRDFERELRYSYEEFRRETRELSVNVSDVFDFFPFNAIFWEAIKSVGNSIRQISNQLEIELQELKERYESLWGKIPIIEWFVEKGDKEKLIKETIRITRDYLYEIEKKLGNAVITELRVVIDKKIDAMSEAIDERFILLDKELKELLESEKDLEKEQKTLKGEIENLKKELKRLEDLKLQLANSIKVRCGDV